MTTASQHVDTPSTAIPDSKIVIGRRYLLHEQLGEGGMGAVYRAVDRLSGSSVALKQVTTEDVLADESTDASTNLRLALAQEFKVLASLRHPNVIGVLDYGFVSRTHAQDIPQPYFTMELLANAQTVLEAGFQKPLHFQVDLLVQMLQALAYVHRRKIIHRDLKPNNALVVFNGDSPVVKVLDFGLSTRREHSESEHLVGTLPYVGPEMLQGWAASELSDLYAVGVIAYEMFAGRHPFDTTNTTRLIRDILTMPPDVFGLDVNPALVSVLEKLLHKTPTERYQKAEEVITALCDAINRPLPPESIAIRESYLQAALLVGREAELDQLKTAMDRIVDAQYLTPPTDGRGTGVLRRVPVARDEDHDGQPDPLGSAWLIGGESGVGKSRIVDELRTLAMVEGALVLRGQAISEGGHPYQLWRDVMRWLALLTDIKDLEADALKTIVPDLPTLLGRDIPENTHTDAFQARDFLLSVVEELLRRFTLGGEAPQPLVLLLEDLHWATGESLLLLRRVNGLADELPILVVATYRDDERVYLPTELPDMRLLKLHRLETSAIQELAVAMLGDAGRRTYVIDFLQRETEGNIFFLVEIVRALAEEAGRLDRVGEMTLPMGIFAGGVQNIVQRRLQRVPLRDRALLQTAAVLGRQIDLDVLRLIDPAAPLEDWLTECANVAVLEIQDGQWRFAHDKLRDALLTDMTDDERRETFRKVATAVESAAGELPERAAALAHYWGMAGDEDKTLLFAARAGQFALAEADFVEASKHLDRAIQLLETRADPDTPPPQLGDLKQGLGQAYFGLGEYMQAQYLHEDGLRIYEAVGDPAGIARAYNFLGAVAFAQNDFELAASRQSESAALAAQIGDRATLGSAQADLGSIASVQGDYIQAQKLFNDALAISRETGDRRREARLLNSLGDVALDLGDYATARTLCLESAAMFEALGERQGIASAYISLGSVAHSSGDAAEARGHYERAYTISEALGDRHGLAVATQKLGDVACASGDYGIARIYYEDALATFASLGDQRSSVTALSGLGNVARSQNDYEYAKEVYQQALDTYREMGDRRRAAMALNNLGNACYELGQDADAWKHYRAALRDARRIGVAPLMLDVLDGMAGLLVKSGRTVEAAELIGFVLNHPALEKQGANFSQRLLESLLLDMTPEEIAAAQARGQARALEDVVAQALADKRT